MTTVPTEIITAPRGALGIYDLDPEARARFGYLARFNGLTRNAYDKDRDRFAEFCRLAKLPSMLAADATAIQVYVRTMEDRGYATATINRRVGTLRGFFRYATKQELVSKDPTLDITVPRIDHDAQYRTWLSTLELAALLKEARKDPRSHAMVVTLGLLGLRVSEMCSLDITDIHREVGTVYLTFVGKGSKAARMQLPMEVFHALSAYIGERSDGPVFLSVRGTRWAPPDVRSHLTTLARRAGIEHHITPHGLRRTLARTLQERGVELGAIQQTLRHKDPRTTTTCYVGNGGGVADIARQTAAAIVSTMAS